MQIFFIEVWPEGITEIQLRISYLPKKIVADTEFTSCTYQEFRIWHETSLKMLLEVLLCQFILYLLVEPDSNASFTIFFVAFRISQREE